MSIKSALLKSSVVSLIPLILILLWVQNKHSYIQKVDISQQTAEWHFTSSDIASRTRRTCRDTICSEYLSDIDHHHFGYCVKKTWHTKVQVYPEPESTKCRFMNGTNRYPMALASFSGSGNTWVRGLLQEVTGLCTGGIYCDQALRPNGFPGEMIRSGATLVVKTHRTDPRWSGLKYDNRNFSHSYYRKAKDMPVFSGAILLIRNPFDAMVAAYNRETNVNSTDHHILSAKPEDFGYSEKWRNFVTERAEAWQDLLLTYLHRNQGHPVLAVKYEDLKRDTLRELKRMLDFLQVPYEMSALRKVVEKDYTKYKRKRKEFVRYTKEQRDLVLSIISETVDILSDNSDQLPSKKLDISDYLNCTITVLNSS